MSALPGDLQLVDDALMLVRVSPRSAAPVGAVTRLTRQRSSPTPV